MSQLIADKNMHRLNVKFFLLNSSVRIAFIILFSFLFTASQGQISFRAQASSGTLSGTTIIVNKPTGTVEGDVMVANIATNGNNVVTSSPGWTLLRNRSLGNGTTFATVLYKVVKAADASVVSYTFSVGTGASGSAAAIASFIGVDTTKPIDTTAASINIGSSKFPIATTITTVTANTAILMLGAAAGTAAAANFWNPIWKTTSPGLLTEIYDQPGTNASVGAAWALKPTIGATGNGLDTISVTTSRWGALLVALRSCTPRIVTQPPASLTFCVGGTLSISASAAGPALTYQWKKNGINVTGANSSTYTKANIALSDSGTYSLTVTNSCGTVTTNSVVVKVIANPTVTISADYCSLPGRIRLTASVLPTAPAGTYTYLWSNGGTRDTTSVLVAGTYTISVSSATGGCQPATASINTSYEMAVNGNFNLGNTGFVCPPLNGRAYQYMVDSPNYQRELALPGRYGIGPNANNYNATYQGRDHTSGSGNLMVVRGYSFIRPMVWQQTLNVVPNTTYYFSGWAMGLDSNVTNLPILRFAINGSNVGSPLFLLPHGQSPTSPDIWRPFYVTWNSGANTTASFSIYDSTAGFSGNGFGLDDISIGPISPFITLTSGPATDTQTVCINTAIVPVTLTLGSGGAPVVTGLPPGVAYSFNGSNLVISGIPSTSGVYNYSVSTTGCSVRTFFGQIICQSQNLSLTSAPTTANQTICYGNAITTISYSAIGSTTSPVVTGLPPGVTSIYRSGILYISGTPTQLGTFNYTITSSGGTCAGTSTASGSITVNVIPSVSITVDSCVIAGSLVLTAVPQNPGVYTYAWNNGNASDTLSVSSSGSYNVTTTNNFGCSINSNINIVIGLTQTSSAASSNQNACLGNPITSITYNAGGNVLSYSVSGLPPGVTAVLNAGVITISGAPTQLGVFNYTVTLVSSLCGLDLPVTYTKTGTITVNANPSVNIAADYCSVANKVKLTATPAPAGTYSYYWSSGSVSDTTLVNTAGSFSVTVTNASGCRATATYIVNTEISVNGNFSLGNTGFVSVQSGNLPPYQFVPDSANFQGELVAPGLYSVDTNANNFNPTYWGHDHTTRNGKFMIIHGYPSFSLPIPGPPVPSQEPIAWQETLTVQPNTTYYFSAWAMGLDSSGDYASLKFMVNGNQIGNILDLTSHGQSESAPDNWQRFYATWNSTNNTSASFSIQNTATAAALTGGYAFGLDDISVGTLTPYITLTSSPATDTQFVCINAPVTPVTLNYGSGGAPTVTGLPAGVTMTYTGTTITISGTPTVAGTFNYTVSTAGCNIKRFYGQIVVLASNLVLVSAATTSNQSVCINSSITNISYSVVNSVTAVSVSGLPAGVNYNFTPSNLLISGIPTVAGTFNYSITITGGGCTATNTYTGTITVKARPVVTITADYCVIPGKVRLTAVPSPAGTHTFLWSNTRTTDTTSVTASGTYTVTVTNSLGCSTTASITISMGLTLTSPASSSNQSVCLGDAASNITYATAGNVTGASVTGLPPGMSYTFASNVVTISGTPTLTGTYNYTVTTVVNCSTPPTITGTIRVFDKPTVTITADYCAVPGKIRLKANPLPAGTYTYLWNNGTTRDTTSVLVAGIYSVRVTNANGCSAMATLQAGLELAVNGNFNAGNTGFTTPLFLNQRYQYIADSVPIQTELYVPGLYGIGPNANSYNDGYQGRDHTTGTENFMIVHGFPFLQAIAWEKTVGVIPNTTYYFSVWAQGLDSAGNNAILKFAVNGTQLGANLNLTNHGLSPTAPDNWTRFYATWNSGASTTASFSITDVQTFSAGNSFGLDDISIGILAPFISLVSPASTDTQTVCLNTPIDSVVLLIGSGATPPVVTGLPPGVNYTYDGYRLRISGAPSALGVYNYTVATTGCSIRTFYGQITAQGQSLVLTSAATSNNQTICIGSAITNIVYTAGGNINANAVSITGLPAGVTYNVAAGIITLSGTPTQTGVYNYTLTVTAGICSGASTTVTATGTLNVINIPTVTITSDYCVTPGRVRLQAVASPSGTYTYYWNNGALTDTTMVDLVGNYTVTVTNSSGCRASASIQVSTELVVNGNFSAGNTGFTSPPLGTQRYIYVPDSVNFQRELYLPGRYGIGPNANNYHDLYWGHDHTTGTGNFMIVHGFAFATPVLWQETVTVTPNTDYYFSAWGMSLNSLGNNGKLKFSINGTQIGGILTLPNRGNSNTSPDNWTRFYGTWNSGASTSAILTITNTQTSPLGNSFGVDDISFASMAPFINLVSSPATDTQTVCINTPIVPVSLNVGSGGNVVVTGLPQGVTYTYNGFNLQITGSPTVFGTFNYTITLPSTCAPRTFNGQIISRGQTLTLTSAAATTSQSLCLRSAINTITLQSAGNVTNVTATGLPSGLTTTYNAGLFTISGTPTQTGVFNFTVTTSGTACTAASVNGTITVKASPVASLTTSPSTVISCSSTSITLTASGGNSYSWSGGLGTSPVITVTNEGLYTVLVTNTFGCVDSSTVNITTTITPNTSTWLGITPDWSNVSNWCGGIPNGTRNVIIPSSVSIFPVVNANTSALCATMTINSGASLTLNNGAVLTATGNFVNNGTLTNNGRITLAGTAIQTFPGPGNITAMDTLQFNNASGITLNKSIDIFKELRPTLGTMALGNFDITLKSNATATASVSVIGNNAGFTYGTGRFIAERYIPTGTDVGQHGKSWQFLAVPVRGAQTVKQSWQENATIPNQNLNPGYGTQITSDLTNALSLGFDVRSVVPSMKVYDSSINNFTGITSTNSYPIQNSKGYMIFVRGNRNDTSFTQAPEPATLRARGTIYGRGADLPPMSYIAAGGYQSIGNPYASAIDFSNITGVVFDRGVSIDNAFYVWDPTLAGTNNLGGYQTISSVNNWIPVPGGTTNYPAAVSSPTIQSGQAFFMHATGAGGAVSFNEDAKAVGSRMVHRDTQSSQADSSMNQVFESKLYAMPGGQIKLADGNVVVAGLTYSNEYTPDDAPKVFNSGENFALKRNDKIMAIEARQPFTVNDTIHYAMSNLRSGSYRIEFKPLQLASSGLVPYLIDQHLQSRTMLSFADTTHYDFSVVSNSPSAVSDRFMIVMEPMAPLPLRFTNLQATRKGEDVQIDWKTDQESALHHFEIERSEDARTYHIIQQFVQPANSGGVNSYHSNDTTATHTELFYRIKAVGYGGDHWYSNIAKVKAVSSKPQILVYPNPVVNKQINITLNGLATGEYQLDIYSDAGQRVYAEPLKLSSRNQRFSIALPNYMSAGHYILKCSSNTVVVATQEIVVQ